MYSGGFYPYDTLEEYWAFWSRYIWINRYAPAPKPVYDELNGIKWKKQRENFETAHDADLRLFYTARRILKEKLDRKPITLAAWKQEYDRLQAEYAKLSPQYKPLREDLMKMRRVQYCVDRVLQRRQPEQEAPKKKQDIEL